MAAESQQIKGNKTQHVYDYVMERIVDGTFAAGESLNIGILAEETGVSLIPTREALRRLESEGLIEFLFHRGVRVRELGIDEYREIMQVEAVLEGLAVGMSAASLTPEDLTQARAVNARMNAAYHAGDFHGYNEGSLEFHGILRAPCPNQHLRDQLDRGRSRVAAVRASVVGYRGTLAQRLSDEHEHLLDRIAAGAPATEIEALMRAHREGTIAHDSLNLMRGSDGSAQAGGEAADPPLSRARA
ncbi:GntR family transcriptional regulator [Leucobacter sp. W1478]|uniref:GntR family transcriptional regulator n=1 Tax=Leucobacter sp. W1478 TaxID=3439065 RepID=UPI003F3CDBB1